MDIESLFLEFHSRLIPSDATLDKARKSCEYIKQVLNNEEDLAPSKFYYSGSYAKSTNIAPLKDIDLALYYSIDDWRKTDGSLYLPGIVVGRIFSRMKKLHGFRLTIRRQNRSIGLGFRDFDIDLVPALWDGNDQGYALIPNRDSNNWLVTSIPLHIEFLKNRDKTYRPYAKTIRIVKAWGKNNAVNFPGFALELLTIKALDTYGTSNNLAVCFYNVMNYISETKLKIPVFFIDYYSKDKIDVKQKPIIIVDPVNPKNNVANSLNIFNRAHLINKVETTLRIAELAFKADFNNKQKLAHLHWYRIFKEPFPKPKLIHFVKYS